MKAVAQTTGLRAASRILANGIVASTSLLVRTTLRGDWDEAAAVAVARRALLGRLERECGGGERACVQALRQAVTESEDAFAVIGRTGGKRGRSDVTVAPD